MNTTPVYPDRVTLGEDGVYRWRCAVSTEGRRRTAGIVLGVCGGVCLVILVMAALTDRKMLPATLLSCLGAMALVGLITWLADRLGSGARQPYEMSGEYVRFVGVGRSDARFRYPDVRRLTIREDQCRIDVKGLVVPAPFFVPREDFSLVMNYILRRLPETVEIVYK